MNGRTTGHTDIHHLMSKDININTDKIGKWVILNLNICMHCFSTCTFWSLVKVFSVNLCHLNKTKKNSTKSESTFKVFRKNYVCFTIHCNPFLAHVAVRDLQSSQRNVSVQPIAAECWQGRGGKLSRILGK